ncbi:hypothetical protein [Nocardia sp. NPDC002869]|uniref:hypothetical protein n=1 Tax=Nocardia sp. NPDC002869 TaxID=3161032 RepID=UPI00398D0956
MRALFVFIGAMPYPGWLADTIALDDHGFVLTGTNTVYARGGGTHRTGARSPRTLETSLSGLFAAGDVRSGSVRRVASAVGEGEMAVKWWKRYCRN